MNIYTLFILTFLSMYFISACLSYGFAFATLQKRREPEVRKTFTKNDMLVSLIYSIGGLFSFAIIISEKKYKNGFKLI